MLSCLVFGVTVVMGMMVVVVMRGRGGGGACVNGVGDESRCV